MFCLHDVSATAVNESAHDRLVRTDCALTALQRLMVRARLRLPYLPLVLRQSLHFRLVLVGYSHCSLSRRPCFGT